MNKNKKKLKRYRLKINPENGSMVDFISQVEKPAIEVDFLKFNKEEFVDPRAGETKDEFVSRCISYTMKEGYEQAQATAICLTKWDNRQKMAGEKVSFDYDGVLSTKRGQEMAKKMIDSGAEVYIISARNNAGGMMQIARELGVPTSRVIATGSNKAKEAKVKELDISRHYDNNPDVVKALPKIGSKFESVTDYPKGIQDTAQRVLNHVEKHGWGTCGTQVGKTRASQLAKGEAITLDTIKRMFSYLSRHKVDLESSKDYFDGCGRLMYDAWGGEAALRWSERYINQQENLDDSNVMELDVLGYKTQNFDMCPGAQAMFTEIINIPMTEDTMGMVRSAAQIADSIFRIEKDVIDEAEATPEQLFEAKTLVKDFTDVITQISGDLNQEFNTSYMMGHINQIESYLPEMMEDGILESCWDGYEPYGFKIVDGKRVPNCVPIKQSQISTQMNSDKMELFGPVLIPDMPIYRHSESMGEYEIIFKKEDIKDIQKHFMKSGFQNNVNLDHSSESAGSYIFESFISDEMIPNPEPFKDLPLGTWFVRMAVTDPKVWADIKTGKRKGFSIEGVFEYLVEEFEKSYFEKQTAQSTNNIYIENKNELENMIKDLFRKIFVDLAEELNENPIDKTETLEYQMVSSADYKIEAREIGQKVEIVDMNNELQPAPDGMYEFEDGFKFEVKDGVIVAIEGQQAPEVATVEAEADLFSQYLDMLAKYPWDQCISDMEDQGYDEESANAICGSIKWQNAGSQKKNKEMYNQLQTQIEEIKNNMITKQQIITEIQSVKDEFKTIFEKFAKVPAEPSKVQKNAIVKDDNKKKFEEFITTIRKANS